MQNQLNANATSIKAQFNCSNVADDIDFLYVLADVVAWAVVNDARYGSYHLLENMCTGFLHAWDDAARIAHYQSTMSHVFNVSGLGVCEQWSLAYWNDTTIDNVHTMRQWMWQSCTEVRGIARVVTARVCGVAAHADSHVCLFLCISISLSLLTIPHPSSPLVA